MTIALSPTLGQPSAAMDLDLDVVEVASPSMDGLEWARNTLLNTSPHKAEDVAVAGQKWLSSALGSSEIAAIENFTTSRHEAFLLRGFTPATTVPTPQNGFLPEVECVLDFDLLHFGVLQLMGIKPYAVDYENAGKLVRNVLPVESASGTASSWGADIEFSWHTDNPNWPFAQNQASSINCIPRYLAFTAVRNPEMVSTDVASSGRVLESLPNWVISELRRPAYDFGAPASNEGFDGKHSRLPIIEQSGTDLVLRFDVNIVTATDGDSEKALSIFRGFLKRLDGVDIVLKPGDFFIFKNERVLHRRKAFTPFPNGQARWLRRVYGY